MPIAKPSISQALHKKRVLFLDRSKRLPPICSLTLGDQIFNILQVDVGPLFGLGTRGLTHSRLKAPGSGFRTEPAKSCDYGRVAPRNRCSTSSNLSRLAHYSIPTTLIEAFAHCLMPSPSNLGLDQAPLESGNSETKIHHFSGALSRTLCNRGSVTVREISS